MERAILAVAQSAEAFIGIDGGASKTRARAIDVDGGLIGEGCAGPGSLTLSVDMAADNCLSALRQSLAGSGIEPGSCRLVCGVAGHRQAKRRTVFERLLCDVGEVEIISDGYAALLGAHRGQPGAIVVTGTGSVGLSLDREGRLRQVGGYGPVVGDQGGGNWLGREAVRAALKEVDDAAAGQSNMSSLTVSLIDVLGSRHEDMLDWIAAADATRFADLVPLIVRQDAEGDRLAARLLDMALGEVCRLIELAGRGGTLPVSLIGGLTNVFLDKLPSTIRSNLRPPQSDPLDGALLRARGSALKETYD